MLLRTRVSLFASIAFAVICVCLAFAALQRENIITERFAGEIINDRSTVWDRIIEKIVLRMTASVSLIEENAGLAEAVDSGDSGAIQRQANSVLEQLRSDQDADRFEILSKVGGLLYSSLSGVFLTSVVSDAQARDAMASGNIISGLGNDRQRNIAIAVGVPIRKNGEVVGIGVISTDIREAIAEMETVTRSTVLIVNRRGRLLAGSGQAIWTELQGLVDLLLPDSLQTIESGDHVYSVLVAPQIANLGSLRGNLISVREVTEVAERQRQLGNIMIGGTVVALALVVLLLTFYMAWSFAPLSRGINMLDDLSRGDLGARLQSANEKDEVGRIGIALNNFRSKLVAMERFRQSRERQRGRQERFIRHEMTQLAATLDDEERATVLEELHAIEDAVRHRAATLDSSFANVAKNVEEMDLTEDPSDSEVEASREHDGLAMMALAFQKMSDRVQNQNRQLRAALETKNTLVAIQKELDIAARVQLSLVPSAQPPSSSYEISGTMQPAKEVGGDFFDHFRLSDHNIGIVIADVSGKGVPAALFMVMTRTVLRSIVQVVRSPGKVLERVNNFLEKNNKEELFVTLFYGILDERTGRFTYANGGHNSPLLVDEMGVRPLDLTGGVVLGMIDGLEYEESHVDLVPGNRLICITDGVTEAFNSELEAYGDDRFEAAAGKLPDEQSTNEDVRAIVGDVKEFVDGAAQFDDITCVVIRCRELSDDVATNNGLSEANVQWLEGF